MTIQTHNVYIAKPIADFVVSLGTDGRVASQGTLSKALSKDKKLAAEISQEQKQADKAEHTVDDTAVEADVAAPKTDGKLIVAEEISEGHVSWAARKLFSVILPIMHADGHANPVRLFFASLGGDSPFIFWSLFLGGMTLVRLLQSAQAWYLGYWAEQYETHDPADVNPLK